MFNSDMSNYNISYIKCAKYWPYEAMHIKSRSFTEASTIFAIHCSISRNGQRMFRCRCSLLFSFFSRTWFLIWPISIKVDWFHIWRTCPTNWSPRPKWNEMKWNEIQRLRKLVFPKVAANLEVIGGAPSCWYHVSYREVILIEQIKIVINTPQHVALIKALAKFRSKIYGPTSWSL